MKLQGFTFSINNNSVFEGVIKWNRLVVFFQMCQSPWKKWESCSHFINKEIEVRIGYCCAFCRGGMQLATLSRWETLLSSVWRSKEWWIKVHWITCGKKKGNGTLVKCDFQSENITKKWGEKSTKERMIRDAYFIWVLVQSTNAVCFLCLLITAVGTEYWVRWTLGQNHYGNFLQIRTSCIVLQYSY